MATITREEVHEALASLNDNVRLARSAIAVCLPEIAALAGLDERASRLRALLLQAIELLRPPHRFPFGSLESRSYDVLTLRYVENQRIKQICEELALGRRQVHRALIQAEERLSQVLAPRVGNGRERSEERDSLTDELTALASQPAQVDLREVAQGAAHLLRPLAERFRVRLGELEAVGEGALVLADQAVLKQVLVQLLSSAIQAAAGSQVGLELRPVGAELGLVIRFHGRPGEAQLARMLDARRIAESQSMGCELRLDDAACAEIELRLKRGRPTSVLVVEDNAGAIELYRRYLASGEWQLHGVSDPRLALDVARHNRPDIVLLDVMMPRMDGWSVLELLRTQPETAGIPVVICSVVDDPELARSLGAVASLRKPLSRGELLTTLRRCLRQ